MTLLTVLLVLVALVSLATDLISTTEESDHEGHSDNDIDVDD